MNSSVWTKLGRNYNLPSGQAMTLNVVRAAFESVWFPKLDRIIEQNKKISGPLKLLALACGSGAEVEVLCGRYSKDQISITATDYSDGMIEAARETVDRIDANDRVQLKVMDAMNIDYPDSTFDVVLLIMGPMLMPDPPRVFGEIRRVLVPNGWSAYMTPSRMETHDMMIKAKRQVLSPEKLQKFKDFYQSPMMQQWGTPEALSGKLQSAGLSKIQASRVDSDIMVDRGADLDDLLDRLFQNPGTAMMYESDLTPDQVNEFRQILRSDLHDKYPVTASSSEPAALFVSANAADAINEK